MNSFIIVLNILFISNGFAKEEKKVCTITEEQMEACGSRMLVVNDNFTLPKTDQDITTKCTELNQGIDCFQDYAKNCLDSFSSRIMGMVGRNSKKMADRICKAAESRKEFLNHLNCWKSDTDFKGMSLCLDKYIVQMESTGDFENDDRIAATCCSYHMLKDCFKTEGEKGCDSSDSLEYMDRLASGVTGDLIKFVCGKYKGVDDCDAKMDKEKWQGLKDLVASNDPAKIKAMKKYSTPFGSIKEMIKKFKQ